MAELEEEPTPRAAWGLARIYIALEEKDEAFRSLEAAFERRASGLASIKLNPVFQPLRDDPRYTDLLLRMHLEP